MMERQRTLVLSIAAFTMGVLVGSITTVVHQNTVDLLTFELPWGLILGLCAVVGFFIGLRLVVHNRWVVLSATLGLVGTIFVYSLKSPGGSVLIPNNVWGTAWAIGPALIATVVLVWPRLPDKDARTRRQSSASV